MKCLSDNNNNKERHMFSQIKSKEEITNWVTNSKFPYYEDHLRIDVNSQHKQLNLHDYTTHSNQAQIKKQINSSKPRPIPPSAPE